MGRRSDAIRLLWVAPIVAGVCFAASATGSPTAASIQAIASAPARHGFMPVAMPPLSQPPPQPTGGTVPGVLAPAPSKPAEPAQPTSCGGRYLQPFDGKLHFRGAYRSPRPSSYMYCPGWSTFGHVRGRFHGGVDISAPTGTPVRAASDGMLSYGRDPGGFGLFARVRVQEARRKRDGSCGAREEIDLVYAHLQDDVRGITSVSRPVRAGEIIGRVGCTGNAKGMCSPSPESHLHVTVQRAKNARDRMDPAAFLGWGIAHADQSPEWSACGR
jgi:murein DD-endopeptidase MepM/ murein hydrolase activator NlpD